MAGERPRLPLGTRIFLFTALVLVGTLGAAILATNVLGERIGRTAARERILAAGSVQSAFRQQRIEQLQLLTQFFASNPEYKAYFLQAIDERNPLAIYDQLDERQRDLGYDFAMLLDPEGRVYARTDDPNRTGESLAERPLIRKVIAEYSASGVWQEGDRLFEAVAVPLGQELAVFAYFVAGYRLDDVRALDVKKVSGTEVTLLSKGAGEARVAASTLDRPMQDRLVAALRVGGDWLGRVLERGETVSDLELELDGDRYVTLLVPLYDAEEKPVGAIVSLASLDKELAGYRRLRDFLLLAGLAALVAALLFSYLISRRIAAPVRRLAAAAAAARDGQYDVSVPEGGVKETDALARSFNQLVADLRQKRDMEEYVARISRNFADRGPVAADGLPLQAQSRPSTLLAAELRRYSRPRKGEESQTLERLSRDLRRVTNAVVGHGGFVESIFGQRVLASFEGPDRSARALAAAAEAVQATSVRENAFDEAEPPAMAIATGDAVSGGVLVGERSERTVVGAPVQQVESLVRESTPGDILLSAAAHADLAASFTQAGLEIRPQRGILSPQPIYPVSAEQAAKATGGLATLATHHGEESEPLAERARATLTQIGPGSLLGSRFEIVSVLGAGGMGVVYKARDRELDDLVALKMLKRDVGDDPKLVERLKSEIKLARRITHPNVLRTYDFGEVDGLAFISMEYVRGLTLRTMLEQAGRLPYSAGLRLARQVLSGLAAAHQLEIIHRDLKPENIILDQMGNAKLMDFGLARPIERMATGETRAGWIVGTPHYLAPEQIEGKEPDRRADVYAMGVVLYEVFTGALPFGGDNPMAILLEHLNQPPVAPREHWPEIPRRLEEIVLRCLEKSPEMRYADAAALGRALEPLLA